MKRFLSVCLAFLMICTMLPMSAVSAFAEEIDEKKAKYVDPEVYFAQCMAGVATDEKSDAATRCNNLYNYYINENIYSPTQSFLDSCYENKSLMKEYDIWKSSSLAADPSSAVKMLMKKEDYYQSLIIAMYTKATVESNAFQELLKNKAINQSKSIISSLCEIKKITEVSQIVDAVDITDPETVIALEKCVSATYSLATVKKVNGVIGDILSYGKDILDVVDRLTVYGTMVELDEATKLWINQMYNSCTSDTDVQLKSALKTLSLASTDFAGAALADVKKTAFVLTKWVVKETVNVGMAGLTVGNPLLAAVFAGLKLGKTVCNIFFETDDVCEQLFTMECIYDVQDLSRRVAESRKNAFISEQSVENAKSYIYAVDCYYESIIKIDIDCMEKFLDKLYNGGILSGLIKWAWGATDDYQECIDALEGLRSARLNNYNNMHTYFKIALQLNYPETYTLYFTSEDTIKVTGLYFPTTRIFPTEYPANYANLLVGEFFNINVMYTPRDTTQKGFVATSDNPDVVRIEGNVMVGVSEGTAKVTVTSTADPFVFYTAEIVVKNRLENVETGGSVRNRFEYTVNNGEATITGLVDGYEPSNLYIPEKIDGYLVTRIGNESFLNCTFLRSVKMSNDIKSIGDSAFSGCTNLENILLSNNITKIGSGWTGDGRSAFLDCTSLKKIVIPDSVSTIGAKAFSGCTGLKELSMPCSAKFDNDSFSGCCYIEKITLTKGTGIMPNHYFGIINNSSDNFSPWSFSKNSIKEIILQEGITKIGIATFINCTEIERIVLPDSVREIGDYAFWNCNSLVELTLPKNVSTIGSDAFHGCSALINLTLSNNLITVESEAFFGCTSLTNIYYKGTISEWLGISFKGEKSNPMEYAEYAYINNVLITDLVIPDGITTIGAYAFSGCNSLKKVIIPSSVTSIGNYAFNSCTSLTNITIPNSVTSIGYHAFESCISLTNIAIPNSVTSIGWCAFRNCDGVEDLIIPGSVTTIEYGTFARCDNLKSVIINKGVKCIKDSAFEECDNLLNITLPNSITSIGSSAFVCHNLENMFYNGDAEGWTQITFSSWSSNPMWFAKNEYFNNQLVTDIVLSEDATCINDYAFEGCDSLISITVSNNVTSIGNWAFNSCNNLVSIMVGSGLETFGNSVFEGCTNLQAILVNPVNPFFSSDENGVLYNKEKSTLLKYPIGKVDNDYTINDKVIVIGKDAFNSCHSLVSITIPSSVTTIYTGAFEYCDSLSNIIISNSVASIDSYTFYKNEALEDIFYSGTKKEWDDLISKSSYIGIRDSVKIHYGTTENHYEVVEAVNATCTEDGYNKYTCPCGYEKKEIIPALGHIDEIAEIVPPTCTDVGYTKCICSVCGEEYKIETESLGHSFENDICTRCGMLKSDCLESDHDYANNEDKTWILTKTGAQSVAVTFSRDTFVERGWDYIYIYDGNDVLIGKYTGDELAGKRIVMLGDTVKIRLTSDSSSTRFGFALTKVEINIAQTVESGGVIVTEGKIGDFSSDTRLKVETLEAEDGQIKYDISLMQGENIVQPTVPVTVKIPVPASMNGTACKVYRQETDGTYTDMNAVYQDGYMVFTTDHFSIYVLTVTDPNAPTLTAGDVNGDGKINAVDARWILQAASGERTLSAEQNAAADVNGDGKINAVDARWILQVASGSRVL